MPVTDFWCMLAIAIRTEEDDRWRSEFYAYLSAGGDPKKFPKRPERKRFRKEAKKVDVVGALKRSGVAISPVRGSFEEYAKMRGMRRIFQLEDGRFVDENGKETLPPPGSVYVPVKKKGG
jgi:hypothetical protein